MSVVEWSVATRRARSFRLVNAVKRGRQLVSIIAFLRIFSFHFVLVSFLWSRLVALRYTVYVTKRNLRFTISSSSRSASK